MYSNDRSELPAFKFHVCKDMIHYAKNSLPVKGLLQFAR